MRNPLLPSLVARVKGFAICLFVSLLLAVGVGAQTQSTTGTIQGTVLDANGAAVPGASVEIKHIETNFTRSLTSDEEGRFVALSLPPGRYTVTVTKQGFGTLVLEQADLTVGQALNLPKGIKHSGNIHGGNERAIRAEILVIVARIGREHNVPPLRVHAHDLQPGRMSGGEMECDARGDLPVSLIEFEPAPKIG